MLLVEVFTCFSKEILLKTIPNKADPGITKAHSVAKGQLGEMLSGKSLFSKCWILHLLFCVYLKQVSLETLSLSEIYMSK